MTKTCTKCFQNKPLTDFPKDQSKKDGRRPDCKECVNHRNQAKYSPEKARETHLQKTYGISLDEYDAMIDTQNGMCAICFSTNPKGRFGRFFVDHDHATGEIRGLLCYNCNAAIGLFYDNVKFLSSAISYLQR